VNYIGIIDECWSLELVGDARTKRVICSATGAERTVSVETFYTKCGTRFKIAEF